MPRKGQPGPQHSPETRRLISEKVKAAYASGKLVHWSKTGADHPWLKGFTGKHHTDETKALISKNRKGKSKGNSHGFTQGHIPWNKGKPHQVHDQEWRDKVSAANSGQNHWNWKGGISAENRADRNGSKRKEWTMAVFRRDYWTCKTCGFHGQKADMVAHHIIHWSKSKELRFDVSNGITLCRSCHCALHKPRSGTGKSPKPQLA